MKVLVFVVGLAYGLYAFASCDLQAHDFAQEKVKNDYRLDYVGSMILDSMNENDQYTYFLGVNDSDSSFVKFLKLQLSLDCSLRNATYLDQSQLPWPWNETDL